MTQVLTKNTASPGPPVTLLVNSSDGFQDCWGPYFTLLDTYWPQLDWPVLLNTETEDFAWPDLDVTASKVAVGETRRLSWSECLMRALDACQTPLVLYMQEDYFLDSPVDHAMVCRAADLMIENPDIAHIGLTKHGSHGPFAPSPHDGFGTIGRTTRYRISTQAGLWRPQILRSYLRAHENGWMFEIYGTWRAQRDSHVFLSSIPGHSGRSAPIDYIHTGIIKGKWHHAMPELFQRHDLPMDFSKRGIYQPPSPMLRKWGVLQKLLNNPAYLLQQMTSRFL